jgi:hypothetical protein
LSHFVSRHLDRRVQAIERLCVAKKRAIPVATDIGDDRGDAPIGRSVARAFR